MSTSQGPIKMRYRFPRLDMVEDVERYREGGFHPVHLSDTFKDGRYHILHKLGYGGFSTAWLARDEHLQQFVSLKILTAEASQKQEELYMLRYLDTRAQGDLRRDSIASVLDYFTIRGPNGCHTCIATQVGGPSIFRLAESPGETAGTRRLNGPLACKLARQLANEILLLHSIAIVHGDITPKNVLLRLANIDQWSLRDVHHQLDSPVKEEIFKSSGEKADEHAPKYIVQPTSFSSVDPQYISQEILLIDLGEAFLESSPPAYGVGTPVSYCSPELLLEKRASRSSDIWALTCAMFEMRSGFPLFESFLGYPKHVLQEMIWILGTPPKPLWPLLEQYNICIQQTKTTQTSLLAEQVREIGMYDEEALSADGSEEGVYARSVAHEHILEPLGTKVEEDEVASLADLLQRSLDYSPENRLPVDQIVQHPWLTDDFQPTMRSSGYSILPPVSTKTSISTSQLRA